MAVYIASQSLHAISHGPLGAGVADDGSGYVDTGYVDDDYVSPAAPLPFAPAILVEPPVETVRSEPEEIVPATLPPRRRRRWWHRLWGRLTDWQRSPTLRGVQWAHAHAISFLLSA